MSDAGHIHHGIDDIEFAVTDMDAAKRFYAAAFGWAFNDYGPEYAGIQKEGGEAGGLRLVTSSSPGGRRFHFQDPSGNELAARCNAPVRERCS
jgi:predicted enzyme related to lactoylglutathione lyase